MILALSSERGSRLHAAFADWDYPLTREGMHQLDLIDLLLMRWQGDKYRRLRRPGDRAVTAANARRLSNPAVLKKLRPHLFD